MLPQDLQRGLICLARDGHVDNLPSDDHLLDLGLFHIVREGVDGIDGGFHVIEGTSHIGAQDELDVDGSPALRGSGGDSVDALEPLDGFFDPDADGLLDLFGRGSGIEDADGDDVGLDLGEDLHREGGDREKAAADDQGHQEVGGDAVFGKPGDGAIHFRPPSST